VLKAANTMLKPIRLGTVKAQPKGIIRDIHNIGQTAGRGSIPTGNIFFLFYSRRAAYYAGLNLKFDFVSWLSVAYRQLPCFFRNT